MPYTDAMCCLSATATAQKIQQENQRKGVFIFVFFLTRILLLSLSPVDLAGEGVDFGIWAVAGRNPGS
jgi:hypothetical protein